MTDGPLGWVAGVADPELLRDLTENSGISPEIVHRAQLSTVLTLEALCLNTGRPSIATETDPTGRDALPALAIPYRVPFAPTPVAWRFRLRNPAVVARGKPAKYLSPLESPPRLYFTPMALDLPDHLRNHAHPLIVVEGEKKALAANTANFFCVGIAGVEAWHRKGSVDLLDDFNLINLQKRVVLPTFDSDLQDNPAVRRALEKLIRALAKKGAIVAPIFLPAAHGEKVGLDDFLVRNGPKALEGLVDAAAKRARSPIVSVLLSDVPVEPVSWLWARFVPRGKLTVLDGDPGLGKSTILMWLAGRVTRGDQSLSSESPLPGPCGVILMTAEDGLADTVRPRLVAADGDPARVVALLATRTADGEQSLEVPANVDAIEEAVVQHEAALVIIDPLPAHLGGDVNANKDQDVRRALRPLAELAERTGAAVVVVRHLNKTVGSSALYRGGGSIGITGAARSLLLLGRDPDDAEKRILAAAKTSLTAKPRALRFALVPSESVPGVARVELLGECDVDADALLGSPPFASRAEVSRRGKLEEAKAFLVQLLTSGPVPSAVVEQRVREAGISSSTRDRAKKELGIESITIAGGWSWSLPRVAHASDPVSDAQPGAPNVPPRSTTPFGPAPLDDVMAPTAQPWVLPVPAGLDDGAHDR